MTTTLLSLAIAVPLALVVSCRDWDFSDPDPETVGWACLAVFITSPIWVTAIASLVEP